MIWRKLLSNVDHKLDLLSNLSNQSKNGDEEYRNLELINVDEFISEQEIVDLSLNNRDKAAMHEPIIQENKKNYPAFNKKLFSFKQY